MTALGPVARRWRLLRLLPDGGWPAAAGLAAVRLTAAALPALTALAAGWLLAGLARPSTGDSPGPAIAALAALMLVTQAGILVGDVLDRLVAQRIDGRLRHTVRAVAVGQHQIQLLETGAFQDDAARAADPAAGAAVGRTRSAGTAAVGQLALLARMLGGFGAAAVVATFSPVLAAVLVAVALTVRHVLRRQWTGVTRTLNAGAGRQRRVWYWSELAVGGAAKEVRLFGLAGFIGGRYRASAFAANAPAWRELWQVLRRQWWTAGLALLGAAAATGVPAAAALGAPVVRAFTAPIGAGQLVTDVLAGLAVLSLGAVGPEAFDIDHGLTSVEAADRLQAAFAVTATTRATTRATTTTTTTTTTVPVRGTAPVIRFEGVSFRYPDSERAVLDGLDLTLPAGQTLAIVGENGAGKTTLVKLLAGLYRPTAGRITVDGVDLCELDPAWWRRHLVAVFQDFIRYPASLADNITLAAPERLGDRDGARAALARSGDSDLLAELPSGLDTSLWTEGTGGTDLSGGQWQRVALARALFAAAAGRKVVVLDEPTAHLDARAEANFHDQVVRALTDTTTVLISHRLSTVRPAQRIVLLRDGRVAEAGTHADLMALGGGYAEFYEVQAAAYVGGAG